MRPTGWAARSSGCWRGRVVVLAGVGGNGGGGIACVWHLHNRGFDVAIVLDRAAAALTGAPAAQLAILAAAGAGACRPWRSARPGGDGADATA